MCFVCVCVLENVIMFKVQGSFIRHILKYTEYNQ